MRRKAASRRVPHGKSAPVRIPTTENSTPPLIEPAQAPVRPPAGRGLGKAGAKRLGRLLKRDIGGSEEATGKERVALPKTPVRLLKHRIQLEAEDVAQTSSASLHVSQLIISVVSQRKHRGGISMVELKQALAGGGYDVFKYSRRVNVETKRLVNNETLVMTTRNTTFRLNNKTLTDTKRIRTRAVKPRAAKEKLMQSPALRRSPRKATTAPKIKAETRRPAAGSKKPARRTRKQPARRRKTIKRRQ
ncbi:histone H1.11R-like [Acanthochromis polyacanthus]|uniref:histone H1.11R-like n=1 Tax=Acanthochromis polyacanthus TaxID=80966 RepID=UPI000B9079A3|nr:histone H1.11R-like [Acanthochromis polyacanthus]